MLGGVREKTDLAVGTRLWAAWPRAVLSAIHPWERVLSREAGSPARPRTQGRCCSTALTRHHLHQAAGCSTSSGTRRWLLPATLSLERSSHYRPAWAHPGGSAGIMVQKKTDKTYLNLQEVPGHGLWLFLYTADLTRAGSLAFHEKEPRKLQCHYQFLKHLWAQSPLRVFLPAHNAPTTRQHPLLPRWKPGAVLAAKRASCSVGRTQRQFSGAWAAADAGAMGKTEVKGYNSSTYNVYYGAGKSPEQLCFPGT